MAAEALSVVRAGHGTRAAQEVGKAIGLLDPGFQVAGPSELRCESCVAVDSSATQPSRR
jgi:hypothetical protein